jgi:hypothetical protein
MRFVSAKQFIFPFGIKRLPPTPSLADSRITGAVEELAKQRDLVGLLGLATLLEHIRHEPRQAFVLLGGLDPRPVRQVFRQSDGHVLHSTDIVFTCFRVKPFS